MTGGHDVALDLDDIQSGALHERPSPYVGKYLLLRIDDRAAGRELVRRLLSVVDHGRPSSSRGTTPGSPSPSPTRVLKALGVPQDSLDSFAPEFQQGMAARAVELGDVGESSPDQLGEAARYSRRARRAGRALARCRPAPGRRREDASRPPGAFGRGGDLGSGLLPAPHRAHLLRLQGRDRPADGRRAAACPRRTRRRSRSRPARSSSATPTRPASCRRCRPRRFSVETAPTSSSESCTRRWRPTGSTSAPKPPAAKRRPCSAPRWSAAGRAALRSRCSPTGRSRPRRRPGAATTTSAIADDLRGFKCPAGAHARRANPRDALDLEGSVNVRLHRMIRRGTSYGPMLPEGVLEDDGADRGIIFVFAGAHLKRQFEFVKTQWLNDGIFIGAPAEKDPLVGPNDGSGSFTIPDQADPAAAAAAAAVRRHPRRRVLLRPRPARHALAGGTPDMTQRLSRR